MRIIYYVTSPDQAPCIGPGHGCIEGFSLRTNKAPALSCWQQHYQLLKDPKLIRLKRVSGPLNSRVLGSFKYNTGRDSACWVSGVHVRHLPLFTGFIFVVERYHRMQFYISGEKIGCNSNRSSICRLTLASKRRRHLIHLALQLRGDDNLPWKPRHLGQGQRHLFATVSTLEMLGSS